VTKVRAYVTYSFQYLTWDRQTDRRQTRRPSHKALTLTVCEPIDLKTDKTSGSDREFGRAVPYLRHIVHSAVASSDKTRKLCYRKDVRAMHSPTIRTWFEARKSISTI